ncbi:MAG: gliding motility-associated C-terminal domain-containing protein [Bacteroidales bacterium]
MKKIHLLIFAFSLLLALPPHSAKAQVGPGGVGTLTNTQLWLKSDSLIAIQPLNYVTSWLDLSGHVRDFGAVVMGQTVPTLTPNVINGYPVVAFSDQGGISGDFLGYNGSLGITGTDAATVVIVARNTTAADEQNGGLYMGQKNAGGANAVRSYGIEYSDAVRFNGQNQVFSDGHTAGNWRIIYYTNPSGAAVSAYGAFLNGTPLTGSSTSTVVPSLVSNYALVGATQMNGVYNPAGYFNGDMTEIAVFSGQLNDAERVVLHNNLGAKYLIPIADDHYEWEVTHSHDVSGIAAFNGTTFTNAWSTSILSVTSPTDLSEGEYLFFGHNKAGAKTWTTAEVPASGTFRLAREWRFDETSDVGTVTVSIPASSLPALPAGYPIVGILVDNDGDFSSGATMHRPTLSGGVYTIDLNIADGQCLTIIAFRPEVNFTVPSGSGLESITTVPVQVSLNYPHTSDVTFSFAATGGTATAGADYTLVPGTVTIPSGSVTGSFTINVIDDALVEPSETVITSISNPSAGLSIGSQSSHTYTIISDDVVRASFSSATASGAEGNAAAPVSALQIVVSGGIISQPGSLIVMVSNGTASSADWSQTGNLVNIPAGDYTTPVSIPIPASVLSILGDLTVEPDETVNLSMNTFVTVTAGAVVNSVYTILNDDSSTVSVTATTPVIAEGGPGPAGTGTFTFTFSNPVSTARTVSYSVSGTATSGTDFAALPGSFVMPAGALSFNLTLTSVADLIIEGDETVRVTVTGVSGTPVVNVNSTPAVITIDDDDLPAILYSPAAVNMAEGSTATIEVWLSNAPAGPVTINVSTLIPGLLISGPATLTFNAANFSTHQVITIQSVENNSLGDLADNVILSVNDALSFDPFDPLPDISIPVTIMNNDVAAIVVNPVSVTVAENGSATFTISLSAAPPTGSVVVDLVSNNISVATINIAQVTFTTANYNIPQTITVTGVNNSTVPDASTTISLTVNDALSYDGYDGVTASVSVNVINDDLAGFTVNPLTLTINEGGPAGQFTVVLNAQPVSDVVFDLFNAAPLHTTHLSQITFTPANWNVPQVVTVTALEDALDADRTDVIAVTVNQSLSDNSFDGLAAQNVTVNIEDNDPPVITGCPANITVNNAPGACSATVTWIVPVSTAPMISTHLSGATCPVGVTTVTYTSTDADGMVSTCIFTVTVNDSELPVVSCSDITLQLNASGSATIDASDLLTTAPTDNCSVASVTLSRTSFTCADLGSRTVTVTVTDASGNISTCNSTVTVSDPFTSAVNAGPDDEICTTVPTYSITGASASNMTLVWSTSGNGTFSDPTAVNPVYTRGAADITDVTLTLTGTKINGCSETLTDEMILSFAGEPAAIAGADKDLCSGTPTVSLSDASAGNGTILWTTSGNGTFSDPATANPVYTFGSADTGPVTLTLTVTSSLCGTVTDDVVITFTSAPVADAGAGGAVCRTAAGFQVAGASYSGGTLAWSSSGDGSFSDNTLDNPFYTFGPADYTAGSVTLTMTVTGGGACGNVSSSATVAINALPEITVTDHRQITCTGLTDGVIRLDGGGGLAPYMFSMDGTPFQLSGDFTGLAAGTYLFELMDGNGCGSDTTLTITEPLPFSAVIDSMDNVTCNGGTDGAVYATLEGGTQPYSISWTGPDGWTASTATVTDLSAGTYSLTVTDLNGCASYSYIEVVTEPAAIEITGSLISDYGGYGVTCPGSADGSISVTVQGGTPPLEFTWTGPGGFTSNETSLTSLVAGTYNLGIVDASGCILSQDYTLTAPESMNITVVTADASCPDTPDGSIDLTVTGGSGTLAYLWHDGVTSADRTAILPGDYAVTVTDENGCEQPSTVTLGVIGENCLRVYEIITPNGDGRNDTWHLHNAELYPDAEVFVYTRWGKLVYHSSNATDQWDGTFNGKLLPNDSYHYVIHLNNGSEPRTGIISIISK